MVTHDMILKHYLKQTLHKKHWASDEYIAY